MPLNLAKILIHYHLPFPSGWWLEVWAGGTLCLWARWTFYLGDALERQSNYRIAIKILSDENWGEVGFILGLIQIAIAVFCKEQRWLRMAASFICAAFIFLLTYSLYLANTRLPGAAVYVAWGVAELLAMILLIRRRVI